MSIDEIRAQFMNYEERRSRLKLLLIELISNKELLSGYLDVKEGHYSLVRLDEGVLDSLLVDTYSVIQDDVELVRNLISLRIHIRTINAKIQIFFSQIALPTTGRDQLLAEQNAFLKERASFLLPIVEGCIRKLQDRYSLVPPTFES
jgi:hypothetical protein